MNIMKLAEELLLEPFRAYTQVAYYCESCKDTGWAIRKEDDAPIACVMCDASSDI